jgi:hypothetical protein
MDFPFPCRFHDRSDIAFLPDSVKCHRFTAAGECKKGKSELMGNFA